MKRAPRPSRFENVPAAEIAKRVGYDVGDDVVSKNADEADIRGRVVAFRDMTDAERKSYRGKADAGPRATVRPRGWKTGSITLPAHEFERVARARRGRR